VLEGKGWDTGKKNNVSGRIALKSREGKGKRSKTLHIKGKKSHKGGEHTSHFGLGEKKGPKSGKEPGLLPQ